MKTDANAMYLAFGRLFIELVPRNQGAETLPLQGRLSTFTSANANDVVDR